MQHVEHRSIQASNRPRVVIAEDHVLIQESIRQVLQPHCDVVATVEDGGAALAAVAAHAPDLLLLDVSLPEKSGFDVVEELYHAGSPVKVIMLTAHRDRRYADRAFINGASGYVMKGSMRTELVVAIREVIGGGRYRSPLVS